jgi:site-specific recombinase XerD
MGKLFCDCVQDYFRSYLVMQRGYGSNTLDSYRDTFKLLISYMSVSRINVDSAAMADIVKPVVGGFLNWLEASRGNSISTRNVRLAHIKSFANYVITLSPDDAGTCASIMSLATKKQISLPPDALSQEEVAFLLADPGTVTPNGLRDSALLALLYDSACRAQELVTLDVCDVVTARPCSVRVIGKGRKGRRVPLLKETGRLIAAYIDRFGLPSDSPLFLNRSGARLTRAGVSNVVERHWQNVVGSRSNIAMHEKVKPHLLRHSKASHLIEENVNIYYVRDFLGHSSVTTTQVYLKSNTEVIRKAIEAASPQLISSKSTYFTKSKKAELLEFLDTLT